ncbi:hypothetical protein KAR91_07365 [Candidatus Pacearchaeota archaeon]|nr:hypothetical protein [Candidatus Pacearchaeota archaeon]
MTSDELTRAVALAVPSAHADRREDIADTFITMAIGKLNRLKDTDINQQYKEFTLTADKSSYKLGTDILASSKPWNMQDMYRTDVRSWSITIVDKDKFIPYARGSTITGPPTKATVYGNPPILEVFPIPDANYAVGAFIRVNITKIEDIDERYYDVVYASAIELITAAGSPEMARAVGTEGRHQMESDTMTAWDGTIIPLYRNIGQVGRRRKADSGNLRP